MLSVWTPIVMQCIIRNQGIHDIMNIDAEEANSFHQTKPFWQCTWFPISVSVSDEISLASSYSVTFRQGSPKNNNFVFYKQRFCWKDQHTFIFNQKCVIISHNWIKINISQGSVLFSIIQLRKQRGVVYARKKILWVSTDYL